ncbi:MAG: hypothetical protein HC908_15505 [Calothrix sp. SM1_7_51]|nr:hypothetical protein [Calothrix sp. SM1_7_51]
MRLCAILFIIILLISTHPVIASSPQSPQNPQILVEQAQKLYQTGQFSQAITFLLQAVDEFAVKGDKIGQAVALTNLSLAWKKLGQLQKQKLLLIKV